MKSYPSITSEILYGVNCIAFDKIDGSNIRAEWNYNSGFYKFGTRRRLLDKSDKIFGESIDLICEYEDQLSEIFKVILSDYGRNKKKETIIAFFEFSGKDSFAGQHTSEKHIVTLFDVFVSRKGLISPDKFIQYFNTGLVDIDTPNIVYSGEVTKEFVKSVRDSTLDGITHEGVVCKISGENKLLSSMFKIKTLDWKLALKTFCKGDNNMYNKLL